VWGSQQVTSVSRRQVEGVFDLYAQGPGVDRSMDVLKTAMADRQMRAWRVIALAGEITVDSPRPCPTRAKQGLSRRDAPGLYNQANRQGLSRFRQTGLHLSQLSGCWVGLKAICRDSGAGDSVWVESRANHEKKTKPPQQQKKTKKNKQKQPPPPPPPPSTPKKTKKKKNKKKKKTDMMRRLPVPRAGWASAIPDRRSSGRRCMARDGCQ